MKKIFLLIALLAAMSAASPSAFAGWMWSPQTGWVGPTGAVKDTPEEQLSYAISFFEKKDYERAAKEFKKLVKAYKESREAAEGQYYLGRSYEEKGDLYKAFLEYRKTIQVYPSTKRFDEILEREFELGNQFLAGKKRTVLGVASVLPARDKAVEIYQSIVDDGSFSERGQLAQYKLGLAHMALGDYEGAVTAFEGVISRYPDSPLVDDARFQIAQASLKGTFKADYDQSPTDLAIRELTAFVKEYPESELKPDAEKRLASLKERRAEHEYQVAQFYEKRHHKESAALYYEAIAQQFPQSTVGPKAAARLQVIQSSSIK